MIQKSLNLHESFLTEFKIKFIKSPGVGRGHDLETTCISMEKVFKNLLLNITTEPA
jgi:hypothetical protein